MKKKNNNFSIFDVVEKERQRIARELHDVSLQNLSHLIHKIELSSLYIDKDPVKAKLELATVQQEMRQIMNEIRTIVFNLHPVSLDDLGLKVTIERTIEILNQRNNFFIKADIEDVSCENKIIKTSILRLIQEGCSNAIEHSKGNKIFISLKMQNNSYILKITDNGDGFIEEEIDKKNYHFGLSIMRERVYMLDGEININSSDNGTSIEIKIPFQDEQQ